MSRLLVCAPEHYRIAYEINPWMHIDRGADPSVARTQWENLTAVLEKDCGAALERVTPLEGLPDMVFTANAGILCGRRAIVSRFRHAERQLEEGHFAQWFQDHGYEVCRMPEDLYFEGAGDLLGFDNVWFGGYGFRSEIRAYPFLGELTGWEILPIQLIDPRFYHLDTCFCPMSKGDLLWFPGAFDQYAQAVIRDRVHESKRIEVPESEAVRFACNAVCIGTHVVIPDACPQTMKLLTSRGYQPHPVALGEFLKAGGAAKCLTLALS